MQKGEVKKRPILFNTEMVRAILDGHKTVTRRALNMAIQNEEAITGVKLQTHVYLLARAEAAEARSEKAETKLLYAQECVAGLDFLLKALDGKAKMDTVAPMARRVLAKYNERFPPAKLKLNNQGEE